MYYGHACISEGIHIINTINTINIKKGVVGSHAIESLIDRLLLACFFKGADIKIGG